MNFDKRENSKKGFTLIEAVVAISIFALLITGIMDLYLWSMHGRDVVWEQLKTQSEGRKVVQDFINEIRRATGSSIGANPIEVAESHQVIFYSNIDLDSWRERVRYFLDSKTLKKGVTKPTGTPLIYDLANEVITEVAHDVANGTTTVFYYYDQDYTGSVSSTPLSFPVDITTSMHSRRRNKRK